MSDWSPTDKPILKLYATQRQFEDTHERLARVRSTSRAVSVDKDALRAILMDYSLLLDALRDHGRVVQEPGEAPAPPEINPGALIQRDE